MPKTKNMRRRMRKWKRQQRRKKKSWLDDLGLYLVLLTFTVAMLGMAAVWVLWPYIRLMWRW